MNDNATQVWKKQSYYDIYRNHQEFASHKWTHYLFIYDQIFARYLDSGKPLRLLEIGVQNGGSLEIWKKYLPPGSEIHGLDINTKCLELDFSANIHFHLGSATDEGFLNHLFADKSFDIIIDDGSHLSGDIISAFFHLFKNLNPGGTYIIEDMHACYFENYGGGLRNKNSAIEFFKQFIDTLHFDYIAENQFSNDMDLTPFLKQYRQEIANISFFDSICTISKYAQTKYVPFSTVVSGNIFKVVPPSSFQKISINDKLQDIETARLMYATTGNTLEQGIQAFNHEDHVTAIECLSAAMTQEPNSPLPYAYLAFVCARQGLLQEAHDFIAQSTRLAPERADLIAALGEVFLKNGKPSEAAKYLREAVHMQPNLFEAYPALAQSLHLSGQSEEAVSLLQTVSSITSNAQPSIQSTLQQILAESSALPYMNKPQTSSEETE